MKKESIINHIIPFCIVIWGLYIYNAFLDFYINDSGLYASLSKQMYLTNDYLSLIHNGKDWLDKPHFPFWVSAFSFKLFGVNPFAYNFPLILSLFLSFYYTFKFSLCHYNKTVAWISVFVLSTAQYTFMSSTEGRIEPYLMLSIIGSIYHFDRGFLNKKIIHLIAGAAFVAIAVMTKGIFVLAPILGAVIASHLYFYRSFSVLFKWEWLFITVLIVLFILPEIYALYVQFDSQPQKVVFNKTGVSGIKWFLWDSQFSRLVNSGPITRANGDYSFFLHTLLWAFLPWCIILYYALFKTAKNLLKKQHKGELYTFFGGMLMLVLFSISKFQLPHYISIVFPFYSIMVANIFCSSKTKKEEKAIQISQLVVIILMVIAFVALMILLKANLILFVFLSLMIVALLIYLIRASQAKMGKYILVSGGILFVLNLYLSVEVYPKISKYRAGVAAAKYINSLNTIDKVTVVGGVSDIFYFYCNSPVVLTRNDDFLADVKKSKFLLCEKNDDFVKKVQKKYTLVKEFERYNSENIDMNFFDKERRKKRILTYQLYKKK